MARPVRRYGYVCTHLPANVSELQRLAEIYMKIGYDRQTVSEQLQRLPLLLNCYAACTDDRAGCACVRVRALGFPAV